MHVAVCIVAFNNPDDVLACVASLSASTYTSFEVVVCENGTAGSLETLSTALSGIPDLPQWRLLHAADNPGYAGGVNRCIDATPHANAWWILNPDTKPDPGALHALIRRLEKGDVDAVGGRVHHPDGSLQAVGGIWTPAIGRVRLLGFGLAIDAPIETRLIEERINFLHGASALINERFLEAVGRLREDYFLYCEDVEWFVRGQRLGIKLGFASEARVLHREGTTTGLSRDKKARPWLPIYLDERNKLLLVRDTRPALLVTAAPATLARIFARYGRRGAWRQLGFAIAGWAAGVRGERGKPPRHRSRESFL